MRTSVKYRDFQPHASERGVVRKLEGIVSGFSVSLRGRIYGVHCNREFADPHASILLAIPDLIEVTVIQPTDSTPLFTHVGFGTLMTHRSLWGFGCAGNRELGDGIAEAAASSCSLRRLIIPGCPMTDLGVQTLGRNSRLQGLNLRDSGITDGCVSDLCRLMDLRLLDVRNTLISADSLERLSVSLSKCRTLLPRPSRSVVRANR